MPAAGCPPSPPRKSGCARLRATRGGARGAARRRAPLARGRLAALAAQRADLEATAAELARSPPRSRATRTWPPSRSTPRTVWPRSPPRRGTQRGDEAEARADAAAGTLAGVAAPSRRDRCRARALGPGSPSTRGRRSRAALERVSTETMAVRSRSESSAPPSPGARHCAARSPPRASRAPAQPAWRPRSSSSAQRVGVGPAGPPRWSPARTADRGGHRCGRAAPPTRLAALVAGGVALRPPPWLAIDRLVAGEAEHARRRLARLCPGVAVDAEGLERLAERLPRLRALHARAAARGRADRDARRGGGDRGAPLRQLAEAPPHWPRAASSACPAPAPTPRSAEETVRAVLDAVAGAAGIERRREELSAEDVLLEQREATSTRRRRARERTARQPRPWAACAASSTTPASTRAAVAEAVAAFRAGCEGRRRHDIAVRRLAELRRHTSWEPTPPR